MNSALKHEFGFFGLVIATAAAAGAASGYPVFFLLVVFTVYLAWHLYNLMRLLRWLEQGKTSGLPGSRGIWALVFRDIQRLQQRNRKSKRNLSRILKRFHRMTMALPDATVELRADTDELQWCNPAAEKYLGLQHKRDNGQRISNLIRQPDFIDYLKKRDFDEALEIPSPADDLISLRIRIIPYSGNRRLLIASDMTRIQMLERTRQDFVANVSHELRSPLTVVTGYLETLNDMEDFHQQYGNQVSSMLVQTQRMNRIVGDLLLLSRLESEAVLSDEQPVAITRLIDAIIDNARDMSSPEGHRFIVETDRDLCLVGREEELYSAFSNLVFNAVRYTPKTGEISISWKEEDDGPVFSVRDTGIGIDARHIPRLTERFYRVDAGRSRAAGGTGLGLAIVKHVLLRHQAVLEVQSEPGKGSEFSCRFDKRRGVACAVYIQA